MSVSFGPINWDPSVRDHARSGPVPRLPVHKQEEEEEAQPIPDYSAPEDEAEDDHPDAASGRTELVDDVMSRLPSLRRYNHKAVRRAVLDRLTCGVRLGDPVPAELRDAFQKVACAVLDRLEASVDFGAGVVASVSVPSDDGRVTVGVAHEGRPPALILQVSNDGLTALRAGPAPAKEERLLALFVPVLAGALFRHYISNLEGDVAEVQAAYRRREAAMPARFFGWRISDVFPGSLWAPVIEEQPRE
jgi:hypothetical protein